MNKNTPTSRLESSDNKNADPITGTHGAHPLGVGIGAAGAGAALGATAGVVAGPIGAVAGAVVGAVVGGLAGKATAEMSNPTDESAYWRENHGSRPYARTGVRYEEYEPAYRLGWERFERDTTDDRTFEQVESELARDWESARGDSSLAWDHARDATRAAWNRAEAAHRARVTLPH